METLRKTMNATLEEYNETNAVMNLVLFDDAIRHCCRISRIINNPGGHALLVGVGGSGKQSLSRLSSFICGYGVYQITLNQTYGLNDLKEDLQKMYMRAGVKDEGVSFLFTDSQVKDERFLVFLNDLLSSGNIPDLFDTEGVDNIVGSSAIISAVKEAGLKPENKVCWEFFLKRVRKNLHVILAFSPVGEDFRVRAMRFPALVNCTVIDWFHAWPVSALEKVARGILEETEFDTEDIRTGVISFMPYSFDIVNKVAKKFKAQEQRVVHTTPKSFLELLSLYQNLLAKKQESMMSKITRLSDGLEKLRQTAETVAVISESLEEQLVVANEAKSVAEEIAENVAVEKVGVDEENAMAKVEETKCNKIANEVRAFQKSTADDLAKAEPAVANAMKALDTLNVKELGEAKTMSKPPQGVDDVFAAVMVLMASLDPNIPITKRGKVKDRSWGAAKKAMLSDVKGFVAKLKTFKQESDAGNVPDINWKEVRPYLELEWFDPEIIMKKNSAAAGLCNWVINIVIYRDIVVTVEPKRIALAKANAELDEANTKLATVQARVKELNDKLKVLTDAFDEANAKKQAAIHTVETGKAKLGLANRLINALASENVRWAINVKTMEADYNLLVGDVLLASAFISYIGPFTKLFRQELLFEQWIPFLRTAANGASIPMSDDPNPRNVLTTDAEVAQWNQDFLPSDPVSTENGCIVTNSMRFPLLIDPQLQGIKWIRKKEEQSNLQVIRMDQKDALRKLEQCMENGYSLLIENLDENIDAILNPVISRATTKKGRRLFIKLGDTEVEFHPNFKLFLHTKLSNPHYPPEVQAEAALVNFSVTEDGLEDQLLAMTVEQERPDLATKRLELISEQNGYIVKMQQLEDDILHRLSTAKGDLTTNVDLIEGLETTKAVSMEINKKKCDREDYGGQDQRCEREVPVGRG
jgi:dynein heavy chain